MTCAHTVDCDPTAPQRARAWAHEQMVAAPDAVEISSALVDDVLLCISELVTNAVRASCGSATLELAINPGRVRVVVTDDGDGLPTPRLPGPAEPHGRGLMIVSAISESWGVEPRAASKTVWAELAAVT